jgi:general stress protein YciG
MPYARKLCESRTRIQAPRKLTVPNATFRQVILSQPAALAHVRRLLLASRIVLVLDRHSLGTVQQSAKEAKMGQSTYRGFASMDHDKHIEIARKGGKAVPAEKRSFSQDHDLAAQAGRKGGQSVAAKDRSFFRDRTLAASAGRKGGHASHGQRPQG